MANKAKKYKRVFTDPSKKIQAGNAWKFPLKVDADLAELIIGEQKNDDNGFNFTEIINRRIRMGYGLTKIKKVKN